MNAGGECMAKAKINEIKSALKLVGLNFYRHNVGKNAAALAYYLLFAVFPMLIFISNLLGFMNLDVHEMTRVLGEFMPKAIVGLIETYFEYLSSTTSHMLMWFSLVFTIWFPMRAVMGLMGDVRTAYGLGKPRRAVFFTFKQLVYTVLFLVVIVLTLFLSTIGGEVLEFFGRLMPNGSAELPKSIIVLWQYLRFLPAAALMFVAIGALYTVSLDKRPAISTVIPGIIFALLSWLIVSIGFSFYVENFSNYTIIYGTLGAVIVLLIWLYLTALILILGAELNAALAIVRNENDNK